MARKNGAAVDDVEVITRGDVPESSRAQARQMISDLARHADEPILHVRVKLTRNADLRGHQGAITAQANVNLDGRLIRAQVSAPSAQEGISLLSEILKRRIERSAEHWEARRGAMPKPGPHEWRQTSEYAHRPAYFPRPAQERRVVRHKAFELASCTPDEAIEDLELMGYDFQLFNDVQSGQDSVVYRAGSSGYRIAQLDPDAAGRSWLTAQPMSVSSQSAAELDEREAIERFNLSDLPFLFFKDRSSGRGHVLYRRYDGHYGIITPAG